MTTDYHDLAPLPTGGVLQRPSCVSQASRAGGASGTRLADESDDDSECLPHQSRAGDASGTAPPSSHLHTAPSSHLAIFTPRIFTPHLGTVRAHHGAPPTSLLPLHACPFTDAPLVHTGRPLVDPSAHPAKEDHLRGARFGARTSPHLRNLAHLRHRALPRGPQRAARALRHERRDGARRRGRAALPPPVRPPLIAI
jgi:hypothetical protein